MTVLSPALTLIPRRGKIGAGAAGMRMARDGFRDWAANHRDLTRPLVWFHAPSVGEGFQAQAVMLSLRALRPDYQIAYTFFSPSAIEFARSAPADVAGFLPPDTRGNARAMLDALRPAAIVFAKTEIWPALVREASERGIPTLLLSATLPAGSSRLRRPARSLLALAHSRLARVGAIAEDDAARFGSLGVAAGQLDVAGDARFDQVFQKASRTATPDARWSGPVLVAGSTWPADEAVLLDALEVLESSGDRPAAILVPHEPTPAAVEALVAQAATRGLKAIRWSSIPEPVDPEALAEHLKRKEILVVDRVGLLGGLYAMASVAWVGGGFGTAGIHSVLEPAAFGVPVLFGPRHDNAREAGELIAAGGGFQVRDSEELAATLRQLLDGSRSATPAGAAALEFVRGRLGAAERGAHLVLQEISRAGQQR